MRINCCPFEGVEVKGGEKMEGWREMDGLLLSEWMNEKRKGKWLERGVGLERGRRQH